MVITMLYYEINMFDSWLLIVSIVLNKYQQRYKYFKSGIIYVQNWRVCEFLKYILAMQKKTPANEPTASNYKSDRP